MLVNLRMIWFLVTPSIGFYDLLINFRDLLQKERKRLLFYM